MEIDKIIVLFFCVISILFVYWFFFKKKEEVVAVIDEVDITVKGGYVPSTISIPKNKTTKINFIREDSSSCLEEVILSDFNVKKYLPLHQKVSITIVPEKAGEFPFSCGMNMFHGKVIVK